METLHATCVACNGAGLLLRGPSGAGKSDLALRLIDGGARLVADDRVVLALEGETVTAHAPPAIAGLIEVYGLGPMPVPALPSVPLVLIVDLVPGDAVERLPQPAFETYLGVRLPLLRLDPFHVSAATKLRLAVEAASGSIGLWPCAVAR